MEISQLEIITPTLLQLTPNAYSYCNTTCHRPIIQLLLEQLCYGQLTRPFPSLAVGWVWLHETNPFPGHAGQVFFYPGNFPDGGSEVL